MLSQITRQKLPGLAIRQRGHQFTTVFEVAHDLLGYPEVQALVREAGYDPEDIRRRIQPNLGQN